MPVRSFHGVSPLDNNVYLIYDETTRLTAIVDPNAEVDPSFTQWNIETKDGGIFAGVIASENPASITMKSLAGVQEIKVARDDKDILAALKKLN